jgi:hypothetical protein
VVDFAVAEACGRGGGTAAHAGRTHDADGLRVGVGGQFAKQVFRARQHAAYRFANPDCQRRGPRLAFLHDIEMVVEGRYLVNLHLGQAHVLGKRAQMCGRQTTVVVLDQMQELDQEIPAPFAMAKKFPDLGQGNIIQRPPFGSAIRGPPLLHCHPLSSRGEPFV